MEQFEKYLDYQKVYTGSHFVHMVLWIWRSLTPVFTPSPVLSMANSFTIIATVLLFAAWTRKTLQVEKEKNNTLLFIVQFGHFFFLNYQTYLFAVYKPFPKTLIVSWLFHCMQTIPFYEHIKVSEKKSSNYKILSSIGFHLFVSASYLLHTVIGLIEIDRTHAWVIYLVAILTSAERTISYMEYACANYKPTIVIKCAIAVSRVSICALILYDINDIL